MRATADEHDLPDGPGGEVHQRHQGLGDEARRCRMTLPATQMTGTQIDLGLKSSTPYTVTIQPAAPASGH